MNEVHYVPVSNSFDFIIGWCLYLRRNAVYIVLAKFVKLSITETKWSKIYKSLLV